MTRRPFKPTPLTVALQAASLLVIGGGLFVILISDIKHHRAQIAERETGAQVQLIAAPQESKESR